VALVMLLDFGGTMATASDRTNRDELIVADGPCAAAERQALSQALRLLPRMPARVAVIDSEPAKPEVKATLLRLDAFIVNGSTVVRRLPLDLIQTRAHVRVQLAGVAVGVRMLQNVEQGATVDVETMSSNPMPRSAMSFAFFAPSESKHFTEIHA
jgi:hypothetical protein